MKQASSDPPDIANKHSGTIFHQTHGVAGPLPLQQQQSVLPLNNPSSIAHTTASSTAPFSSHHNNGSTLREARSGVVIFDEKAKNAESDLGYTTSLPITSTQTEGPGSVLETKEGHPDQDSANNTNLASEGVHDDAAGSQGHQTEKQKRRTFVEELRRSFWLVATYSWMNVLLVFVPIGIVVANVHGVHGGIVFAMNCIAVIPLAGLLSHATESVASKMGDSLGALLNVTFGNAVELIIFIIALVKNQIRIVQASLLGSILANLLLILGMGFFLGGLRYREQIYNSTVTQMSACLLSLSVISLVLPTAFHASFKDSARADAQSLKISRGTSVVLLLVYIIYLMFQLKSHAYMYESTPQHIVDAESTPGPAAAWLDTSSSSDSGSSSSSDSDSSNQSRDTISRKMKKVLRGGRRRKLSITSMDTNDAKALRNGSAVRGTGGNPNPNEEAISEASSSSRRHYFPRMVSNDDGDTTDEEQLSQHKKYRKHRHSRRKHKKNLDDREKGSSKEQAVSNEDGNLIDESSNTRRVNFAIPSTKANPSTVAAVSGSNDGLATPGIPKRPLAATFRSISAVKTLAPAVFVQKANAPLAVSTGPVPRVRYGIRRTNSLPDRLGHHQQHIRPAGALYPAHIPVRSADTAATTIETPGDGEEEGHLTRTAAIILLLATTGLVAVCAEFLVDSIKEVTESSGLGEIFIGLIILPIVGNAAEHVTAVTVAMKNKMDLAIGVAVGSSIQIALFVTPLVVVLGWIMDKQMTLYFTLFETVCLFVSAFMVNFLVLDGRSNYLEGALLCAVYIIIAVVAFFSPEDQDANHL